jgi:hypothetical protein
MNKTVLYLGIIGLIVLQWAEVVGAADHQVEIFTPSGTRVLVWVLDEAPSSIEDWNQQARNFSSTAQLIANASRTYNCHGYAWHVSEGGLPVWLRTNEALPEETPTPQLQKYWEDGSYSTPIPWNEGHATKLHYYLGDHSAITTKQTDWVILKWGRLALMRHRRDDAPYTSGVHYYVSATPPVQHFAASYGGTGTDAATVLALAHDGSYIVAGNTTSFGANNTDAWLLKLGRNGGIPFENLSACTPA